MNSDEEQNIAERYKRRNRYDKRYDPLSAAIYKSEQEKERVLIKIFAKYIPMNIFDNKIIEVGAGYGNNIWILLKLGFDAHKIKVNELLPDRLSELQDRLPSAINLFPGNFLNLELEDESFDIVFQSMVFTSILENEFKVSMAKKMWSLLKPGGFILWYDFFRNNPFNQDVKGIQKKEIRELFPDGVLKLKRITLAPPLSRLVTKIHPFFYNILNLLPILRTHYIGIIKKI